MVKKIAIHPKYLKAAEAELSAVQHEGQISADIPRKLTATLSKVSLSLAIDSQGLVLEAKHFGAEGAPRAILEALCRLSVGRPIRELSEHGLIYVEHQMRDPDVPHEIKGLLTPENADPSFQAPLTLVRNLFKQYTKSAGVPETKNFWTPSPTPAWLNLSPQEQRNNIETALKDIVQALTLNALKIEIIEIRNITRVVVSVTGELRDQSIGSLLMKIESLLKKQLDPQLELTLESIEDRNKRVGRTQIPRSVDAST